MDFANERYVRLYTRDGTNWFLMGWEGQCLFCLLLRKVDRSGVLDIGELDPVDALVVNLRMPHDILENGLSSLLRLGVVVCEPGRLVIPKYMEAQEARTSDAERKRRSRERRRDMHSPSADSVGVTNCDPESQIVTETTLSVTGGHTRSHAVTRGHNRSQPVTPSLAEPSRADLNQAEDLRGRALAPVRAERPIQAPVAIGAERLLRLLGIPFPTAGKWAAHLCNIGKLPDAEWAIADRTLRDAFARPGCPNAVRQPKHISDYLHEYAAGNIPGKTAPAADGGGSRYKELVIPKDGELA